MVLRAAVLFITGKGRIGLIKKGRIGPGREIEFAEFYSDLSVVRERDRSELGVRSDDRTPQTFRALGRQELPPSPSLLLRKDPVKLAAHSNNSPRAYPSLCKSPSCHV